MIARRVIRGRCRRRWGGRAEERCNTPEGHARDRNEEKSSLGIFRAHTHTSSLLERWAFNLTDESVYQKRSLVGRRGTMAERTRFCLVDWCTNERKNVLSHNEDDTTVFTEFIQNEQQSASNMENSDKDAEEEHDHRKSTANKAYICISSDTYLRFFDGVDVTLCCSISSASVSLIEVRSRLRLFFFFPSVGSAASLSTSPLITMVSVEPEWCGDVRSILE